MFSLCYLFLIENVMLLSLNYNTVETHSPGKVFLTAVTRFKELEEFYLQIRQRNSHSPRKIWRPESESPEIRNKICENVVCSHFFKMHMKDALDVGDERIRRRLRKNYPILFENIYKKSESTLNVSFSIKDNNICYSKPIYRYEYSNLYESREISIGDEKLCEDVFRCPVKDRRTGIIDEYFISREYALDKVDENRYPNDYFAVRFVFLYTSVKNLKLLAVAEEPATHFRSTIANVEDIYTFRREYQEPASSAEDDELCTLTKSEKFRLCTIVLSSIHLGKRVLFWPSPHNIGYRCKKKKVSLQIDGIRKEQDKKVYKEWVISCKAIMIEENSKLLFYISRGYESRKAFVYRLSSAGDLALDHECINVHLLS